jgi:hypothetical protein
VQWPGVQLPVKPPNSGLRLYGGAAFERCLNEFQEAAQMLDAPAGKLSYARLPVPLPADLFTSASCFSPFQLDGRTPISHVWHWNLLCLSMHSN